MRRLLPSLAAAALLLPATPAAPQEREIEAAGLPRTTADRLIGISSDAATIRLPGNSRVPSDSVLAGNVVVMGPLRLAGRVEGELVVIHGDLELEPGAVVAGDLTVVDGEVFGAASADIAGTLIAYRRDHRYVQRGERARTVARPRNHLTHSRRTSSGVGFHVRFTDYNRVEGMPVEAGPSFDTGGANPLRVEAGLIWRTQGQVPFATDRVGYRVMGEQFVGGRRELRVGAGARSMVLPIEGSGLSDRENAWSTFGLTHDLRDHYEARGWWAFARVTPRSAPIDAAVEFHEETHSVVGISDPWTLFRSSRSWRPQPLVAEGSLRSVVGRAAIDTRDDRDQPIEGWLVAGEWRQGVGGSLALPDATFPPGQGSGAVREVDSRFQTASLDVRRYQPFGSRGSLALRGFVAGSPDGETLPPQHQFALGGVGSVPGHPEFAADCGARRFEVTLQRMNREQSMFPSYGCDRIALFQAEYRGPIHVDFGFGPKREAPRHRSWHHHSPSWAVFFNAGRGWANGDPAGLARADSPTIRDAGLGFLFGSSGVYWAVPIGEGVRGSTLTIRLDRRF